MQLDELANQQNKAISFYRGLDLKIIVGAAICAKAAASVPPPFGPILNIISSGCIFSIPLFQEKMSSSKIQAQAENRAYSQKLKAEYYKFCAGVSPYNGADALEKLKKERKRIVYIIPDENVSAFNDMEVNAKEDKNRPPRHLNRSSYMELRVQQSLNFYRNESRRSAGSSRKFNRYKNGCLYLASMVGAASQVSGTPGLGFLKDASAWSAVMTSASGAFGKFNESNRYDSLHINAAKAARDLDELIEEPPSDFKELVDKCEEIVEQKTNGWLSKRKADKTQS
jgi:hypothetical protein